jgi:lipopolysaccharide transport system permease protein
MIHYSVSPTTKPVALTGLFASFSGAMLLAVQLRLLLPFGKALASDYQAHFPALYVLLALVIIGIELLNRLLLQNTKPGSLISNTHTASRYFAIALASCAAILLIFPDVSQLQLVYFFVMSIVLYALLIALPRRIYLGNADHSLGDDLMKLWRGRALLRLWIAYNIRARYSQTILGILWIILLPLLTALILAVAFSQILRIQLDVPIVSFFLAGLVPFNLFNTSILNGTRAILNRLDLVTQVYFPREILVLLVLGEALVDFMFTFGAMIFINAGNGLLPNIYYLYLPLILLILLALALGTMLITSSLSLLVRDIPQLVGVFMQLLFYITPIIYPSESIPPSLRYIYVLNPMAAIVQAFRDVVVYSRPPDFVTLYYPIVLASVLLYLGYSVFKSVEGSMADMI